MKSPRRRTASFDVGGRYVFIVPQRTGWESLRFASRQKARRSALQLFEHFLGVAVRLHAVPRLLQLPALVHQECRADDALAAAWPVAPRAVRRGVVARDTEHRDAERFEGGEVVVELASLDGATRCVVLRVKVHDILL